MCVCVYIHTMYRVSEQESDYITGSEQVSGLVSVCVCKCAYVSCQKYNTNH